MVLFMAKHKKWMVSLQHTWCNSHYRWGEEMQMNSSWGVLQAETTQPPTQSGILLSRPKMAVGFLKEENC